MQKEYPQSRWLNDAKALEVEVRQASGKPVSPDAESDEDLKLLAINGLMSSDPERAVPLLQKVLADPKASPRVKERALFVVAQSRDQRAREILAQIAKGGGNPDMQLKAVEYLGMFSKGNTQALADIYSATADAAVKRAVMRGLMMASDSDRLLTLAKSEKSPELRKEAIRTLGMMRRDRTGDELVSMYTSESDKFGQAGHCRSAIPTAECEGHGRYRAQGARHELEEGSRAATGDDEIEGSDGLHDGGAEQVRRIAGLMFAAALAVSASSRGSRTRELETSAVAGNLESTMRGYRRRADRASLDRVCGADRAPANAKCAAGTEGYNASNHLSLEGPTALYVLYRVEQKQIVKLRMATPDCEIDAGGLPVIWLTGVKAAESVRFLESLITENAGGGTKEQDRVADSAVSSIALHNDPAADRALDQLLRSRSVRVLAAEGSVLVGRSSWPARLRKADRSDSERP